METGERKQTLRGAGKEAFGRARRRNFSGSSDGFFAMMILGLLLVARAANSFLVRNKNTARSRYSDLLSISMDIENPVVADRRPHEQRTTGSRAALRLNHGFRFLYRHEGKKYQNMTSMEYLQQFYSAQEIYQMNQSFPPLLDLSVTRHLHPKTRFLQETMGIDVYSPELMKQIPPQYFGARLERVIAPRHAFLVHHNLPHGKALLEEPGRWTDFILACRTTKRFCALCNQWRDPTRQPDRITSKQIEAFDTMFGRGLLAAARNEICQVGNEWPLEYLNISSAELIGLNLKHGANPQERDNRGSSLLHWAAGTGNLEAIRVLLPHFPKGILEVTERDGATPLHWATAGANSKEFGTGGHTDVCRYLLAQCSESGSNLTTKELVNQLTKDGNSPLMWASWSGTLDTVKLMVRTRADYKVANRNGCTAAHWAASGGNLEVCKYLADIVGVDFFAPNYGGNTPLTHAVAFGRLDVVQWLRDRMAKEGEHDEVAAALAETFCNWKVGDERRKDIMKLFQDDYWDATNDDGQSISIDMDQALEFDQI